jgi:hypothetical protein
MTFGLGLVFSVLIQIWIEPNKLLKCIETATNLTYIVSNNEILEYIVNKSSRCFLFILKTKLLKREILVKTLDFYLPHDVCLT